MKPRNFPARKLARQMAAENRRIGYGWPIDASWARRDPLITEMPEMVAARNTRTKKRRAST